MMDDSLQNELRAYAANFPKAGLAGRRGNFQVFKRGANVYFLTLPIWVYSLQNSPTSFIPKEKSSQGTRPTPIFF
jgi:hypothetical protein